MEYEKDALFDNFTFNEEIKPSADPGVVAHEVIFSLFIALGIFGNIAIIYVIFRFQTMRKSENMFLVNWAISDLISLLLAPSGYLLISILDEFSFPAIFICFVFDVGQIFQITTMLFAIFVCIDWFIAAYFEKVTAKFRSYQKYYLGAVWIFCILMASVITGHCIENKYLNGPMYLCISLFFIILAITTIMQCSRAVRKYFLKRPIEHSPLLLNIATGFSLTYVLAYFTLMLSNITRTHPVIGAIAEILMVCNAFVNFILLYKFDEDFHACFLQALRRGKSEKSVCNYDNPLFKSRLEISLKDDADLTTNDIV